MGEGDLPQNGRMFRRLPGCRRGGFSVSDHLNRALLSQATNFVKEIENMQKTRPLSNWMFFLFSSSSNGKSKIPAINVGKPEKGNTDGDEIPYVAGHKKYVPENLQYYVVHPKLSLYYEPLKPTKMQRFVARNRKMLSFMLKVAEYDQDKTMLIMTNNPVPCPLEPQGKDAEPHFFYKDFLVKKESYHKLTEDYLPPLPQKKIIKPKLKSVFPVTMWKDAKSKQEQLFRFSTKNDFKSEGKYSTVCNLRKQKNMFPQLTFAQITQNLKIDVTKPSESDLLPRKVEWEPLTLASLLELTPTKRAPGESAFRNGRVKQWFLNKAMVTKRKLNPPGLSPLSARTERPAEDAFQGMPTK